MGSRKEREEEGTAELTASVWQLRDLPQQETQNKYPEWEATKLIIN